MESHPDSFFSLLEIVLLFKIKNSIISRIEKMDYPEVSNKKRIQEKYMIIVFYMFYYLYSTGTIQL